MIKLKEMKEKAMQKSCLASASIASVLCSSMMPVAFAGGGTTPKYSLDYGTIDGADKLINQIGGYILTIFRYVGIFLLIWAAAQLFLAFKNEDADSKSKAMMMLIVAVLMVMIKSIVNGVLSAVS